MAFNVKKQALMVTARQLGINIRCMVKFGFDASGSLANKYGNGCMQDLVEKAGAFGVIYDDNGEMEGYVFDTKTKQLASLTEANVDDYVKSCILVPYSRQLFGGTDIPRCMNVILDDSGIDRKILRASSVVSDVAQSTISFFDRAKQFLLGTEPSQGKSETQTILGRPYLGEPILIGILTDGDTNNEEEMYQILKDTKDSNIFWLFLPIGNRCDFSQLRDPRMTEFANVDVVYFEDPAAVSDGEFYDRVFNGRNASRLFGNNSSGKLVNWMKKFQ